MWFEKIIALFLIFCLQTEVEAQLSFGKEFDALIDEANGLYEEEAYESSGKLYDKALALKEGIFPLSGYYKDAINAWAKARNLDKTYFYLFKLLEKGWITFEELYNSRSLQMIKDDLRWNEIVRIVEEKSRKYGKVAKNLEDIWHKDQTLRQLFPCAKEEFKSDSISMAYFKNLMSVQDSLNLVNVEEIIDTYGWLGANKIGDKANGTLWLIIQHSNQDVIQKKYLPLIKESVLLGETAASKYAFLVDRIAVNNGELQVYGTQICTDKITKQKEVCPIYQPEKVDDRRQEVGFEPLKDYLQFFEIEYKYVNEKDK
ncbi:MAG: hypothetical protein DHS20C18_50020 [Saprospiraceae bacterium]|nr:MAG: hypothetical protein DHS20C18_50020 [Saprospiraceae bacterium]